VTRGLRGSNRLRQEPTSGQRGPSRQASRRQAVLDSISPAPSRCPPRMLGEKSHTLLETRHVLLQGALECTLTFRAAQMAKRSSLTPQP
jgi:hypothetical protein